MWKGYTETMENDIVTAWKISNRGLDEDYKPETDLYVYKRADGTGGVRLPDGTEWFTADTAFNYEPRDYLYLTEVGETMEVIDPASMPPSTRA
jgi:hypothetical protein